MTTEIAIVLAVLALAIVMLATEVVRADLVALGIMLALPWLGSITTQQAFSGLASGAVVSMAAVMVLGRGVDRSGLTRRLTRPVLAWSGGREGRLRAAIMSTVGALSGVMQNIGAAALFLPAVARIARRGGLSPARLLMPMGFAAILGGTLTMIGSGPLILLGDLLRQNDLEPFGLFAVTPYGLALLVAGIALFALLGARLLPARATEEPANRSQRELIDTWRLVNAIHELLVPAGSRLVGLSREEVDLKDTYDLHLVALAEEGEVQPTPWRHTRFGAGQVLAMLGSEADVRRFAADYGVVVRSEASVFHELQSPDAAGFAEVLVSPRASVVGQAIREFALRRTYGVEPLLLLSGGEPITSDFSDRPLQAGDTLLVYGEWQQIHTIGASSDFVVVTDVEHEDLDESRQVPAALCFAAAIALALLGFPLALSLATGALAMIATRVLSIDAAYRAIDWRTIVLIGGLIPLGVAMDETGAAGFLAEQVVGVVEGASSTIVMAAVAGLATLFSLFMSNVAATVVLVPLVIGLAERLGLDPRMLALLVAVAASNSFVLPTHQVNALLMTAGGYRNADYVRAGGLMTLVFVAVAVASMTLLAP